jgi:hypothetical protein
MNEGPETKPERRIPRTLLIWLILFTVIVFVSFAGLVVHLIMYPNDEHLFSIGGLVVRFFIGGIVGASILLCLWLFMRWLCCWRNLRHALVGLAILATLAAIFYTEEDWRGKRAWENCIRELEAKGAVLDWDKYIPPPVPDDQNFFTYSTNIMLRFHKSQTEAQNEAARQLEWLRLTPLSSNSFPVLDFTKSKRTVVAELNIMKSGSSTSPTQKNPVINLNRPDAGKEIKELIQIAVGHTGIGATGIHFSELQLSNLSPARIFLESDSLPTPDDLKSLIPSDTVTNIGLMVVEATADPKVFQVKFVTGQITAAADYLQWSDQFVPAFDEVREALKRPYAVIPGDYSKPFEQPIPNFVTMRAVAQTLAQRAQCLLLLNRPEAALSELTLMHDVCRILEKPPTGKPETLVEAMINVAITGLYVATVQEGFRLHAWQAPQLAAIQAQLSGVNLPPWLATAFQAEQAATCHTAEITQLSQISQIGLDPSKPTIWKTIMNLPNHAIDLAPRGWVYQNMAVCARMIQIEKENVLDTNQNVIPERTESAAKEIAKMLENHHSPFYLLAGIAIANITKAMEACAFNQTLANQAQIACALERDRLAHGEYPETLDALLPQFIEKLPHDIIGGQPLHYRRTDDGKFLLYSVGWNETDDGGQVALKKDGSGDREQGDWVWQYPQK